MKGMNDEPMLELTIYIHIILLYFTSTSFFIYFFLYIPFLYIQVRKEGSSFISWVRKLEINDIHG